MAFCARCRAGCAMTAVDTVPSTPTAMTPYGKDYLTDPRLGRVGIMTLKKHIEKSGQVEKDLLKNAATKFAVINLVEQFKMDLDDFLLEQVGPPDAVPEDEAITPSRNVESPTRRESLEAVSTGGRLSAIRSKDKEREKLLASREPKSQASEKEVLEQMEKDAAERRRIIEERKVLATALKEHLPIIKSEAAKEKLTDSELELLCSAMEAAKAAKVPLDLLAPYEEKMNAAIDKSDKFQLSRKLKAIMSAPKTSLDLDDIKKTIADAKRAGVPAEEIAVVEKMASSEEKTIAANKMIMDVVEEISKPERLMTTATTEMRGFLQSIDKNIEAVAKLEAQLDYMEKMQGFVKTLQGHAFPKRESVMKVKTAQLRMTLDEARAAGVPEEHLARFDARYREACDAQELMKQFRIMQDDIAKREQAAKDRETTKQEAEEKGETVPEEIMQVNEETELEELNKMKEQYELVRVAILTLDEAPEAID